MKIKTLVPLFLLGLITTQLVIGQDTTGSAISQQKFKKLIKKKNSVVIDVRTPEEYQAGFIASATNLNVMDSLNFLNTMATLDKKKKYLLYCKSSRRSGKALLMMKNMGFQNIRHLKGGITEWKDKWKKPS
jgi:rhodanese-related sulfurtransferase